MKIISVCKFEPFTLLRGVFAWVLLLFLATSFQTSYRDLPVISIFLEENKVWFFPWGNSPFHFCREDSSCGSHSSCGWISAAEAVLSLPLGELPWCTAVSSHTPAVLHLLPSPGFLTAGKRLCRGKWGEEGNEEREKCESMPAWVLTQYRRWPQG